MTRSADISRTTGETSIELSLALDGVRRGRRSTGVGFFDHLLDALARHGRLDLDVRAQGDLETGAHHTVEDTGIVLGQALDQALGDRAGIQRFGQATVPMDEARASCAIDVSGRPFCAFEGELPPGEIPGFETDLAEEFLRAVANSAKLTLHVRVEAGTNAHHMVEAAFKAFARALRVAVALDPSETRRPVDEGRAVSRRVAILDYGMGNLRSAEKALEHVGADGRDHPRPRARARRRRRRAARRRRLPEGDGGGAPARLRRAAARARGGRRAGARHLPRHAAAVREHDRARRRRGPRPARGPGRALDANGLKVPHIGWNPVAGAASPG